MGYKWVGPIAPYGTMTDDRRMFTMGTLEQRPSPLPLSYKAVSGGRGHEGSIVVGSIDHMDLTSNPIMASGRWLSAEDEPAVKPAMAKAKMGVIGPSVDLTKMSAAVTQNFGSEDERPYLDVESAKISGATLVHIPAFDAELRITTSDDSLPMAMTAAAWTLEWFDGELDREEINMGDEEDRSIVVAGGWQAPLTTTYDKEFGITPMPDGLVAGGGPLAPPLMAFDKPELPVGTILPWITPDGRFFTYVAPKDVCHTGFEECILSPPSKTDYMMFHQGSVLTQEGTIIRAGKISLGGGHANRQLGMQPAVEHYDNVSTAVAVVRAGEDEYGTFVAGALLPGVTDEQIATLRRSPLSGDWRYYAPADNLELIAALTVNTPGFPLTYVASGVQMSLTASYAITEVPGVQSPIPTQAAEFAVVDTTPQLEDEEDLKQRIEQLAAIMAADAALRAQELKAMTEVS